MAADLLYCFQKHTNHTQMKKLLLLILCTTTLGLVSCKKETIIQESTNRTFEYNIARGSWTLSADRLTYSTILNIPEVDNITLDDEAVLVYITNPGDNNRQKQLPFVYDIDAYSFEISNGRIRIDLQSSDAQATQPILPDGDIKAKVIIIPSTFVN